MRGLVLLAFLALGCAAPQRRVEVDRGEILCVAASEDYVLIGASNDRLRRYHRNLTLESEVRSHRRGITCVVTGDGEYATGGPDRTVRRYDGYMTQTQEHKVFLRPPAAVAFTTDGDLVAASMAGEIARWSPEGERTYYRDGPAQRSVMALALSPDGEKLAWFADGGNLRVWSTRDGERLGALRIDELGFVGAVAMNEAGLVATGAASTGRVDVWDPVKEERLLHAVAFTGGVRSIAFRGNRLAAASSKGEVVLFDLAAGERLGSWTVGWRAARRIAFDPEGRFLYAAGPGPGWTSLDTSKTSESVALAEPPPVPWVRASMEDLPRGGQIELERLALPDYDPPELREGDWSLQDFSPGVRVLAGREITVNGYPLFPENKDGRTRFLLSRFPPGCCVGNVPVADEWIEVEMERRFVDPRQEVTVTGVLEIGEELDELGFALSLYRMRVGE